MIGFKVKAKDRPFAAEPEMPLLWYLLDLAGFTGTSFGCGMSL